MDPQFSGGMPVQRSTSGLAVSSLIFGILAICPCGCWSGIIAIICGHMARSKAASDPRVGGEGMALAGLIMGYFSFVLAVLGILGTFLFAGSFQGVKEAIGVAVVQTAQIKYAAKHDGKGPDTIDQLAEDGDLDKSTVTALIDPKSTLSLEPFTSEDPGDKVIVKLTDETGKVTWSMTKGGAISK